MPNSRKRSRSVFDGARKWVTAALIRRMCSRRRAEAAWVSSTRPPIRWPAANDPSERARAGRRQPALDRSQQAREAVASATGRPAAPTHRAHPFGYGPSHRLEVEVEELPAMADEPVVVQREDGGDPSGRALEHECPSTGT